jgi:hypothetical protein
MRKGRETMADPTFDPGSPAPQDEVRAASIERIVWAASGIGFLALTALGLAAANLLSTAPYPSPFGPPFGFATDVGSYFLTNRSQVQAVSFLYATAALCLLVFVGYAAGRLADVAPAQPSALPWLAVGSGMLGAGFWLITALLLWVLSQPETAADPPLVRAVHDFAYLTGGPAHVLTLGMFVGVVSLAAQRHQVLPRWIAVGGQVAGLLGMLSVFVFVADVASLLLPLGRSLALLWILAICVTLLWSQPERGSLGKVR